MSKTITCIVVLSLIGGSVSADDYSWAPGNSNDNHWDNPNNWIVYYEGYGYRASRPPGPDDVVSISENTSECQIDGEIKVNKLYNEGKIVAQPGATHVSIWAYRNVDNKGTISTGGASVEIGSTYSSVNNSGTISGSIIEIMVGTAMTINNQSGGTIQAGSGSVFLKTQKLGSVVNNGVIKPGNGGNVYVIASKIINHGSIRSLSGTTSKLKTTAQACPSNVTFIADSIVIASGDSLVLGDTLHFRGRAIIVRDVNWGIVQADHAVEFYTSSDGFVDLSGIDQAEAIYCNAGPIRFFSDNIIPPAEGVDYVCFPAPNVSPTDTTLIDADVSEWHVSNYSGVADTFAISIQNQSTASKILNYSVSSVLGWVNSFSGSTKEISPFGYFNFDVIYTIPAETTAGDQDTVMTVLTIGESFADTSHSTILCLGEIPDTRVRQNSAHIVNEFRLHQNYPNPFNPETTIGYAVKEPCRVVLKVFNLRGQEVATLVDAQTQAGSYSVRFDAKGLASGIYFYKIEMEDPSTGSGQRFMDVRKMIVLE